MMVKKTADKVVKMPKGEDATTSIFLKDRAYEMIKVRIMSGELPAGSFLSIGEVAGWFGMSKTPVREAFQRLEAEGFVTISPQQGIAVQGVSMDEIVDLFAIRALLESYIVSRLTGRLQPAEVEILRTNISELKAACGKQDAEARVRLDREFHSLLYRIYGNRQVQALLESARDRIFFALGPLYGKIIDSDPVVEHHEEIVDAMLSGDRSAASRKMRDHLKYWQRLALQDMLQTFEEDYEE